MSSQIAIQALEIVKVCLNRRNAKHPPAVEAIELEPSDDPNGNPHWLTFCPVHNDVNTPSLHVSYHDKVLFHCRTGCPQAEVFAKLTDLGCFNRRSGKSKLIVNNPAHAEAEQEFMASLPLDDKNTLADIIYNYRTADNKPAFWVLRADTAPKLIRPLSSVTDPETEVKSFQLMAWPHGRPLYNLPMIVKRPEMPVLVVEGEKTAEAALEKLPAYLPVTWAGGAAAVAMSDWKPLRGRKVTLLPDNDEPGIRAMEEVAKRLFALDRKADVRIAFREPIDDLPQGWDAADPEGDVAAMVAAAEPFDAAEFTGPVVAEAKTAFEDFDRRLVPIQIGPDVLLVDQTRPGKGAHPLVPFTAYYLGSRACVTRENVRILPAGEKKDVLAIDLWAQGIAGKVLDDFVYAPSTLDRIVDKKLFNTFCGFPHVPKAGDGHKIFLDHFDLLLGADEKEYLLDWAAHMLQSPQEKPGTFILITGAQQGTGKTAIGDLFCRTLGELNANYITPHIFQSNFNGYMANRIFIYVDEFNMSGKGSQKQMEDLRSLVTSDTIQINEKGIKLQRQANYLRILGTTNALVPHRMEIGSRRDVVLEARSHPYSRDQAYFGRFYAALKDPEAMANWTSFLMERKIVHNIKQALPTDIRNRMVSPSDPVANFLYDVLCGCEFPPKFGGISRKGGVTPEIEKWPENTIYLPRGIINEWISEKYGLDRTSYSLTLRMKTFLGEDVTEDRRMRFDVWEDDAMSKVPHATYCFRPLAEMRKAFEAACGQSVSWPTYAGRVPDDDKVVKLGKDVF